MFYQAESIQLIPFSGQSCFISTAQSASYSQKFTRNMPVRLGRFRPSAYRGTNNYPVVPFQCEYYVTGSLVEQTLGLKGNASVVDLLLATASGYSTQTIKIGARDLYGESDDRATIYIESGVLTSYSFSASVADVPKVQIQMEGTDLRIDTESQIVRPPHDDLIPVPRACDLDFNFPTGILGVGRVVPQSISIQIPLARTTNYKVGSPKPYSKILNAPVIASVTLTAFVESHNSITGFGADSLERIAKGNWLDENIDCSVYAPSVAGEPKITLINFHISKPYLENISYSSAIGNSRSVTIDLSVPVSFENGDDLSNIKIS